MLHCTMTRMPVPMPGRPTRDLPPPLPGEYPANLEGVFENAQEQLIIRPIRPSDEAAHANFFAHQTPDDIRFRFFSALKQIPPKLMFLLPLESDRTCMSIKRNGSFSDTVPTMLPPYLLPK